MKFDITAEYEHETKLGAIKNDLQDEGLFQFIETNDYSDHQFEIFAVLSCLSPESQAKQRIRYSKTEQVLYCDIMLNYEEMISADDMHRRDFVASAILKQLPEIVDKYPFLEIDAEGLADDLRNWFTQHGWISNPN